MRAQRGGECARWPPQARRDPALTLDSARVATGALHSVGVLTDRFAAHAVQAPSEPALGSPAPSLPVSTESEDESESEAEGADAAANESADAIASAAQEGVDQLSRQLEEAHRREWRLQQEVVASKSQAVEIASTFAKVHAQAAQMKGRAEELALEVASTAEREASMQRALSAANAQMATMQQELAARDADAAAAAAAAAAVAAAAREPVKRRRGKSMRMAACFAKPP